MSSLSTKGILPIGFGFENQAAAAINHVYIPESKVYQGVLLLESSEKEAWLPAMQAEFNSLTDHQVFSFTELPKGKHTVGC